ncbi:DUF6268 family outer membrane beta-barrel protein [Salinimicrobium sp. TIG7-5_MAKvit]|uniref:DUF6268 family outer membrane beta-barrel protein n=1 Tax=Salinimicrobium sp. TIG7-5_MAKvit TaxID=3121289 RepID=UPI003C6E2956
MLKKIMLILFFGFGATTYGQFQETGVEGNYNLYPAGSSDVGLNSIDVKGRFLLNFGKLKLQNETSFENYNFSYPFETTFNTEDIENYKIFGNRIHLGYSVSGNWDVHSYFKISLASNFQSGITSEDFLYTGGAYILKKGGSVANPSYFKIGAGYETYFGKPQIYPLVSYYKRLNEEFTAEIGFPKTEIFFTPNEKYSLSAKLDFTGTYLNLGEPLQPNLQYTAEKTGLSSTVLSINYNYVLDDAWSFNIGGGYLLNSKYRLLDKNNNEVLQFEIAPRPIFSTGIKLNLEK